jgi:hypothetical protein
MVVMLLEFVICEEGSETAIVVESSDGSESECVVEVPDAALEVDVEPIVVPEEVESCVSELDDVEPEGMTVDCSEAVD